MDIAHLDRSHISVDIEIAGHAERCFAVGIDDRALDRLIGEATGCHPGFKIAMPWKLCEEG